MFSNTKTPFTCSETPSRLHISSLFPKVLSTDSHPPAIPETQAPACEKGRDRKYVKTISLGRIPEKSLNSKKVGGGWGSGSIKKNLVRLSDIQIQEVGGEQTHREQDGHQNRGHKETKHWWNDSGRWEAGRKSIKGRKKGGNQTEQRVPESLADMWLDASEWW